MHLGRTGSCAVAPRVWLAAVLQAMSLAGLAAAPAHAQASASPGEDAAAHDVDELARKVSNPVAYMISIPIHADFDFGDWPEGESHNYLVDVEPVIPFRLSPRWNMISHTDFPIGYRNPVGSQGGQFGLGDISQSLSFTPSARLPFVLAVGAEASLPTATRRLLGSGKLSLGPSVLILKQSKTFTVGMPASHLWSVAGDNNRDRVSLTEFQPFVAWHLGGGRTLSANLDATYDWQAATWDLPVSLSFSKILKIGNQALSLSFGGKYWLDQPTGGSEWGLKTGVVLLFPQAARNTPKSARGR